MINRIRSHKIQERLQVLPPTHLFESPVRRAHGEWAGCITQTFTSYVDSQPVALLWHLPPAGLAAALLADAAVSFQPAATCGVQTSMRPVTRNMTTANKTTAHACVDPARVRLVFAMASGIEPAPARGYRFEVGSVAWQKFPSARRPPIRCPSLQFSGTFAPMHILELIARQEGQSVGVTTTCSSPDWVPARSRTIEDVTPTACRASLNSSVA